MDQYCYYETLAATMEIDYCHIFTLNPYSLQYVIFHQRVSTVMQMFVKKKTVLFYISFGNKLNALYVVVFDNKNDNQHNNGQRWQIYHTTTVETLF